MLFLLSATVAGPALALAEETVAVDDESSPSNPSGETGGIRNEPKSFYDLTRKHPIAIEAQLAPFGSPIGHMGIAADISILPPLALYGGIGAGGHGAQWALGIRPRLAISDSSAITATLAYSRGEYQELHGLIAVGDPGFWNWGNTSWANADLGYEYRDESDLLVHVSTGISGAVQTETPVWSNSTTNIDVLPPSSPGTLFYVAVAIGLHFGGS